VAAYRHRLVFDLYPTQERDLLLALVQEREEAEQQAAQAVHILEMITISKAAAVVVQVLQAKMVRQRQAVQVVTAWPFQLLAHRLLMRAAAVVEHSNRLAELVELAVVVQAVNIRRPLLEQQARPTLAVVVVEVDLLAAVDRAAAQLAVVELLF
jgi:hypothetical protein